jgi:hypothetical protein
MIIFDWDKITLILEPIYASKFELVEELGPLLLPSPFRVFSTILPRSAGTTVVP